MTYYKRYDVSHQIWRITKDMSYYERFGVLQKI